MRRAVWSCSGHNTLLKNTRQRSVCRKQYSSIRNTWLRLKWGTARCTLLDTSGALGGALETAWTWTSMSNMISCSVEAGCRSLTSSASCNPTRGACKWWIPIKPRRCTWRNWAFGDEWHYRCPNGQSNAQQADSTCRSVHLAKIQTYKVSLELVYRTDAQSAGHHSGNAYGSLVVIHGSAILRSSRTFMWRGWLNRLLFFTTRRLPGLGKNSDCKTMSTIHVMNWNQGIDPSPDIREPTGIGIAKVWDVGSGGNQWCGNGSLPERPLCASNLGHHGWLICNRRSTRPRWTADQHGLSLVWRRSKASVRLMKRYRSRTLWPWFVYSLMQNFMRNKWNSHEDGNFTVELHLFVIMSLGWIPWTFSRTPNAWAEHHLPVTRSINGPRFRFLNRCDIICG